MWNLIVKFSAILKAVKGDQYQMTIGSIAGLILALELVLAFFPY